MTMFQHLLSSVPQSQYATLSARWLAVLRDGRSSHPTHALFAQYVAQDLLEREAAPSQARTKSQDKRVEELTRQLEMLKHIEQQRRVHDLPLRRLPATGSPQ
jgi:hypothetical protein